MEKEQKVRKAQKGLKCSKDSKSFKGEEIYEKDYANRYKVMQYAAWAHKLSTFRVFLSNWLVLPKSKSRTPCDKILQLQAKRKWCLHKIFRLVKKMAMKNNVSLSSFVSPFELQVQCMEHDWASKWSKISAALQTSQKVVKLL